MTQTNPLAMGGGQLSAALVAPPQQVQQQQGQMMVQPQQQQQQQQPAMVPGVAGPAGAAVRGPAPTPAQLEAERQQNQMMIKQLQQTLEAAQQKDIHLKVVRLPFLTVVDEMLVIFRNCPSLPLTKSPRE